MEHGRVVIGETCINASVEDGFLRHVGPLVAEARYQVENRIAADPFFAETFSPVAPSGDDPSVSGYEWIPYDTEHRACMLLRAGGTGLIENYNAVRISNLVKMFDTNPHMKFVEKWNNIFVQAMSYGV